MTGGMIFASLCNAPLSSAPPHPATQRNAPTFPPHLRRDGRKTIQCRSALPRAAPQLSASRHIATSRSATQTLKGHN